MEDQRSKSIRSQWIWWFFGISACVKLLLIPSYRSTDFEVHRHWLALTHSLPLSKWYFDQTSPWTLDYPPFFAYFERFLSIFANLVDPLIVDLQNGLNYASETVIHFQRISVIISDLSLLYGVHRFASKLDRARKVLILVLIVWSPMLVIVDHLHFQYNGFLIGILFVSLSFLEEGKDLAGGLFFAVLLCFKHLFAVAAPVFFVYLLRHYCWRGLAQLSKMGFVVVAVFAAAFGPFVYHGQMQQVINRMFPFGRGLCHAYWAPNFWVFYIILDKGLAFILRRLGFSIDVPEASFTGGLVGDSSPFAILPQITPLTTFTMVLLALSPCLVKAWRNPQPRMITRWVAYAYICGFLFGWHVHEKASLHFVIPLAIVAVQSIDDAKHFFILSTVSCYSLFPLLFGAQEYPIKVLLLLSYTVVTWLGFSALFRNGLASEQHSIEKKSDYKFTKRKKDFTKSAGKEGFTIGWIGKSYLLGIVAVELWGQILHPLILGDRLPFIPLMLISIYCAIGVMYSWIWQLTRIVRSS